MPISPLSAANAYQAAQRITGQSAASMPNVTGAGDAFTTDFSSLLKNAIADASQTIKAGETAAAQGATGKADIVNVVNAVNAAELTLETVVAVRDKVISAYQDILKMPI